MSSSDDRLPITDRVNRVRLIQWANGRGKHPVPLTLLGDNEVLCVNDATVFGYDLQLERSVQQRRLSGHKKTRKAQVVSVVKSLGDEGCERFAKNLATTPPKHFLKSMVHLGNQSLVIRDHGWDSCFLKHLIQVHGSAVTSEVRWKLGAGTHSRPGPRRGVGAGEFLADPLSDRRREHRREGRTPAEAVGMILVRWPHIIALSAAHVSPRVHQGGNPLRVA